METLFLIGCFMAATSAMYFLAEGAVEIAKSRVIRRRLDEIHQAIYEVAKN